MATFVVSESAAVKQDSKSDAQGDMTERGRKGRRQIVRRKVTERLILRRDVTQISRKDVPKNQVFSQDNTRKAAEFWQTQA